MYIFNIKYKRNRKYDYFFVCVVNLIESESVPLAPEIYLLDKTIEKASINLRGIICFQRQCD